jgi:hypothetical protein
MPFRLILVLVTALVASPKRAPQQPELVNGLVEHYEKEAE